MDAKRQLLRVTALREQRKKEALRIYRPQPQQVQIHTATSARLLFRGGNQSGKTLNGAVRFSDCATGFKRFLPRKVYQGMKLLAVSLDFTLMSDNIYKKLFEPGAFDVCSACGNVKHVCEALAGCEDLGEWNDHCYESPPLIPDRYLAKGGVLRDGASRMRIPKDGIAWRDKARLVPERAYLNVPAENDKNVLVVLDFKSTDQGRKKFQGVQWDGAWFDEEATNDESIVAEVERGLLKRKGWFQVTATPLAAGLTLFQWHEKSEEEEKAIDRGELAPEKRRYEEVILLTDDNAALDSEEIEHYYDGMGEEEERVRRSGAFLVQQGLIYREFNKDLHVVEPFEIPWEWTIYDSLDPGHANAFAILFAAVDPHGTIWIFDELYMRRPQMREVVMGWRRKLNCGSEWINERAHWSQRTVIDPNAEQQHAGMDKGSVRKQIHRMRRKYDFKSYDGETGTYKANNDVQGGIFAVKGLLRERTYTALEHGDTVRIVRPRLQIFSTCTHTLREIRRYRYARPPEGEDVKEHGKTKAGVVKKDDHLMDTLRYLSLMQPRYVPFETRPDYYANEQLRVGIDKKRRKMRKTKRRRLSDRTRC